MTSTTPYHKFKFEIKPEWGYATKIGSGAYGEVFLEKIQRPGRSQPELCAVKKILTRGHNFPRKQLEAEIETFSRLVTDQWFVEFFGWNEDKDYIYLAMEYIELGDLGRHIKGGWTEGDTKVAARQLLQGLKAMHEDRIIHRDLKPENIFPILLEDKFLNVKIGDFGVSKRVANNGSSIFQTGVGTCAYMAPEIIDPPDSSENGYTNAVDYWSLGCIIHQMVAGKVPFSNTKELNFYQGGIVEYPRSSLDSVGCSNAGIEFIKALMTLNPTERLTAEKAREKEWYRTGPFGNQVSDTLRSSFKTFRQSKGSETSKIKTDQKLKLPQLPEPKGYITSLQIFY